MTPRVLFVGRTRYRLPLGESLARKWDALSARMDAARARERHRLRPALPARAAAARSTGRASTRRCRSASRASCARSGPTSSIAESPYEAVARRARAARSTRSPAKLVVEVHGDWHVSTRLYGSRVAARARAARRPARGVGGAPRRRPPRRLASSPPRSCARARPRAGRASSPTYSDLGAFSGAGRAAAGGAAPRSSSACSSATRTSTGSRRRGGSSARRVPEARLHLVGDGTQVEVAERLVARGRASGTAGSSRAEVAAALDASRALLLPSASEGLPRIAIEAFLRGRAGGRRARPAGSRTSSRTASTACSSSPATTAALAAALERVAHRPRARARGSARARTRRRRAWRVDARASTPTACAPSSTRSLA